MDHTTLGLISLPGFVAGLIGAGLLAGLVVKTIRILVETTAAPYVATIVGQMLAMVLPVGAGTVAVLASPPSISVPAYFVAFAAWAVGLFFAFGVFRDQRHYGRLLLLTLLYGFGLGLYSGILTAFLYANW